MLSDLATTCVNYPVLTALVGLSGIFWMIVYVEAIRLGFRDRIHAMPTLALAFNLFWEGWYSYIFIVRGCYIQGAVNICWFLLDIVILTTFIRSGRKEFDSVIGDRYFWPWTIFSFVMAGAIVIGSYFAFVDVPVNGLERLEQLNIPNYGCWYMAYAQNLVMSILFIRMLFDRKSTQGQSLLLAIAKCLGTLAPTIAWGYIFGNLLVIIIGTACFFLDVAYIVLLCTFPRVHADKDVCGDKIEA